MAKRRRPAQPSTGAPVPPAPEGSRAPAGAPDPVATSTLSLHDLFQRQAREMLDRADLDEEQKQSILVAMSCPCCGAGAMSFTAKLRRRT